MTERTAEIRRKTNETDIAVSVGLDGTGARTLDTGVPFFDHMLDQIARHGLIDLTITAKGDTEIDDHHTVEDIGIALGQAIAKALGDKKGIVRYGTSHVVLDESLSRVVLDLSGRPHLTFEVEFARAVSGRFELDLVKEFFQALVNHAGISMHIDNIRGDNAHHQCETIFKAFGRALRQAVEKDPRAANVIPSTKGAL